MGSKCEGAWVQAPKRGLCPRAPGKGARPLYNPILFSYKGELGGVEREILDKRGGGGV